MYMYMHGRYSKRMLSGEQDHCSHPDLYLYINAHFFFADSEPVIFKLSETIDSLAAHSSWSPMMESSTGSTDCLDRANSVSNGLEKGTQSKRMKGSVKYIILVLILCITVAVFSIPIIFYYITVSWHYHSNNIIDIPLLNYVAILKYKKRNKREYLLNIITHTTC